MARGRGSRQTRQSFRQAAKRIERTYKDVGKAVPSGLRLIGEEIRTDVAASRPGKGIPRDEGVLASTLRVRGPMNNEVEISAGGPAAPYAMKQHEELSYKHRLGEAKYLTRGIDRWERGVSARKAINEMIAAINDLPQVRR